MTRRFAALLASSLLCFAQPPAQEPRFELVSIKHTGDMMKGSWTEGGTTHVRQRRGPGFQGLKFSCEAPLSDVFRAAFSPLVKPWREDSPAWMSSEYYDVEAIAPAGSTRDDVRAMLRTMLADRLGLKYHLTGKETPIYALVRGTGELRLTPPEAEPDTGGIRMSMGVFRRKSASLADFASVLSVYMDLEVFDRTGIEGAFRFDIDWSQEFAETMGQFHGHPDPAIVFAGVKKLGLKLEPRKEVLKEIVVDHVNREPTPN